MGFDLKQALKELGWAIFWIALGLGTITVIQLWIFPVILVPLGNSLSFPSLGIQASDWNTVRAIWFAEVPLAFLLRRVLGSWRQEALERESIYSQNIASAFDLNGIDDTDHLEWHAPEKTPPKKKGVEYFGYIINTNTHKRYRCDKALSYAVDGLRITKVQTYATLADLDKYCDEAKPKIERLDNIPSMKDLKPRP